MQEISKFKEEEVVMKRIIDRVKKTKEGIGGV